MKKILTIVFCIPHFLNACQNINVENSALEKNSDLLMGPKTEIAILNQIDSFFKNLQAQNKDIILRRQATTPVGTVIAEYQNPRAEDGIKAGKQNKKVEVRYISNKE